MMCRMGRASDSAVRLSKETKMDFTKIDLSQFDVTKLMDASAAIEQIEKNTKTAIAMIPDAKSREMVSVIAEASIEFARAQALAAKSYADAVKQAVKI